MPPDPMEDPALPPRPLTSDNPHCDEPQIPGFGCGHPYHSDTSTTP